jgi:hypothetical protein
MAEMLSAFSTLRTMAARASDDDFSATTRCARVQSTELHQSMLRAGDSEVTEMVLNDLASQGCIRRVVPTALKLLLIMYSIFRGESSA